MRQLSRVLIALAIPATFAACGGSADAGETARASGEAPSPAKSAQTVKMLAVGDTGTYESFAAGPDAQHPTWTVKLEEVRRSTNTPSQLLAKITYTAVADCIVSNISVCGYSARHFALVLSDGTRVTGSSFDISETPKLDSGSLQPGDSMTGYVGFAVPPGAGEVALMFEPYPGQIEPQFGFTVNAG